MVDGLLMSPRGTWGWWVPARGKVVVICRLVPALGSGMLSGVIPCRVLPVPGCGILSKHRGGPRSLCRYPCGAQSRKPGSERTISSAVGVWGKEVKYSAYSYSDICTGQGGRWWGAAFYPGGICFLSVCSVHWKNLILRN